MSGRDVGRDLDGTTNAICSYAKFSYSQTFSTEGKGPMSTSTTTARAKPRFAAAVHTGVLSAVKNGPICWAYGDSGPRP